jgi:hypothetical protein
MINGNNPQSKIIQQTTNSFTFEDFFPDILEDESMLLIEGFTKSGQELFKINQVNSTAIRLERFLHNGNSGLINLKQQLNIQVPALHGLTSIKVYTPKINKGVFSWELKKQFTLTATRAKNRSAELNIPKSQDMIKGLRPRLIHQRPKYRKVFLQHEGSSKKKVDLVLAGDGYTYSEKHKWLADADDFKEKFFRHEPFKSNRKHFNVVRLDTYSRNSGAGENYAYSKANFFGSHYNCNDIERLLCIDNNQALRVFRRAFRSPKEFDIRVIIVNDKRYGASGGFFSVVNSNSDIAVLLHEVGHSFGGLADEYEGNAYSCDVSSEPKAPNVTLQKDFKKAKWRNIPGTGHFEGGKYCKKGVYRAYRESLMRNLDYPFMPLHINAIEAKIMSITGQRP